VVARYKMSVGRRINSATLIADARHSWLDALSSAGALAGLVAVALGWSWGDPVAGIAVTVFICHVGYEVTADAMRRLADGVEPDVITRAEAAAGSVRGVVHADLRPAPRIGQPHLDHTRCPWCKRRTQEQRRPGS
jgi:divalent metal cation (Fe/Co/Zn/Cd) transporter